MTTQYATEADLQAHVGDVPAPIGAEADRVLRRASELIDYVTSGAAERAYLTEDSAWRDVLRRATVEQVEFWIEVGEEHDIAGMTGHVQAGRLNISKLPGRLGPRALRTLLHHGLYWAGVPIT